MKIYSLTPHTGTDFIYIENTGLAFDEIMDIAEGEKMENLRFNLNIKWKTKKIPDLLGPSTSELFISSRFKEVLEQEVKNQQIHYIKTTILKDTFWFLNILGVRDCMDYERSKYTTKKGVVNKIENLVIEEEKLEEYDIFRLKHNFISVFVTEPLKNKLEEAELQGIEFISENEAGFLV